MRLFIILILLSQIELIVYSISIFNLPKFVIMQNKINEYNFNLFNLSNFDDEHMKKFILSL
jgi:hypothetical protein